MCFFERIIKELVKKNCTVDLACSETDASELKPFKALRCNVFPVSTSRNPLSGGNFQAIKELKNIIQNGKYDIVHCHTPVASACVRIACRKERKKGTRVIYTAHGFHFYKGAPFINWVIFYPIELLCSIWTDSIITINKEDYSFARKHLRAKNVEYIPGVGIDIDRFRNTKVNTLAKRKELDIPKDAFVLLSVGELNENKNHQLVIKALQALDNGNIHYLIAGSGPLRDSLRKLAEDCGVGKNVHLLGFRNDVNELYKAADMFVLPSYREGLNVSTMEAMAAGVPCILSSIRGNKDMISEDFEWCFFSPNDVNSLVKSIKYVSDEAIRESIIKTNNINIQKYGFETINNRIIETYEKMI